MVRQIEATQLFLKLKAQCALPQEWSLEYNKSPNKLGACWHQQKKIVLSVYLLNSREKSEVGDTLLHEIAHALVGPGHNHDDTWKETAKSIGCTGMICGQMHIDQVRSVSPAEQTGKKHVAPLTKKCPVCGMTAVEESRATFGKQTWTRLACKHLVAIESLEQSQDSFENWESKSGKKLYHYQVEGARFTEQANGRVLIADEPGLGKTVQAISFLKFHSDIALPALWVCKTTLKVQAAKELVDWCDVEYFPQILASSKSFVLPGMKVYVISMDLLRNFPIEKLKALGIKTLIFDECQHIKNPDAARTQEVRRLVNEMDFTIMLSGTPWKNRGSEYFSVLNMLAPERFPSYAHFKNKWVSYKFDEKKGKYVEGGINDIPAFREYTKDFVIRRLRKDVLPDLPPVNRQLRYVELDKLYGESYEKAEERVANLARAAILEGKGLNIQAMAAELMYLKHITGLAKVDAQVEDAKEFLDDREDWEKLTLFHHHIDVGDELEKKLNVYLKEQGYSPALRMLGGMEAWDRNRIQEKFKNDKKCRILIASTLASGEGLNLQFCQNASMMERQWNPANEEQAELRFSRPLNYNEYPSYLQDELFDEDRSPNKVSISIPYLICADTIDEMLTNMVESKRLNFRRAMNTGEENLTWDENEMIRDLTEAILRKRYGKAA
jgi:Superfamily II DNA/RNA helicases, SNF2 family